MFQELTQFHQRMNIVYLNTDLWAPHLLNYSVYFLSERKRQKKKRNPVYGNDYLKIAYSSLT